MRVVAVAALIWPLIRFSPVAKLVPIKIPAHVIVEVFHLNSRRVLIIYIQGQTACRKARRRRKARYSRHHVMARSRTVHKTILRTGVTAMSM